MLASGAGIFYLPAGVAPLYVLGLLLGIGSGAAMLPYTVIKEVNPENVKAAPPARSISWCSRSARCSPPRTASCSPTSRTAAQ
jgi:hypothetical protein